MTSRVPHTEAGSVSRRPDIPTGQRQWRRPIPLARALLALLICLMILPGAAHAVAQGLKREKMVIVTATGTHEFLVEIADTRAARTQGLMFRRSLGPREGMLFFYDKEQPISMWMRNTYIPLDMVFIRADGTVHRIETDTEPFSERIIASGAPVLSVLEVHAGTAREIALKPGDRIEHRRFHASTKP